MTSSKRPGAEAAPPADETPPQRSPILRLWAAWRERHRRPKRPRDAVVPPLSQAQPAGACRPPPVLTVTDPTPTASVPNEKSPISRLWAAWRERHRPPKRRLGAAWRELALSRINDAAAELDCIVEDPNSPCQQSRLDDAGQRLGLARDIVERRPALRAAWSGVDVERAWLNIHAVEVTLIRLSDPVTVSAKIPDIIADASQVLRPDDERLKRLREYKPRDVKKEDREFIAQDVRTVYAGSTSEHVRARSFRNILFAATFVLTVFAVGFAILAASWPEISLCATTHPPAQPCPRLWHVEVLGLLAASLIGALAIRRMRGTSTPYAVPMASLLVKLPSGALTAVGGLLLIQAGFLGPAVAAANTAQLVAYALIFGASQQTFTRLIDRQAQNVLDAVPSTDRDTAKDSSPQRQES
jgi:hypothetical protein